MRDIGNGAIVLGNAINRDHPLNRGLVAHWLAQNGQLGGTWFDLTQAWPGNITTTGGTYPLWWSGRNNGRSLKLDGTNDLVRVESSSVAGCGLDITSAITVTAWANSTSLPTGGGTVASKYKTNTALRSWWIGSNAATPYDKLRVLVSADGGATNFKNYETTAVAFGVGWVFIGFTFFNNAVKVFINGIERAVTKTTDGTVNSLFSTSARVVFGSTDNTSPSNVFAGYVDDIRICNRVMGDSEVWQLYNESRRGYPTMLNRLSPLRTFLFGSTAAPPASSTFDVIGGGCGQFMIGAD